MLITRYAYINKGEFYNETIYGKDDKGISAPRKSIEPYNKTEKYGGYKSLTTAYFSVVESKDKKGKAYKKRSKRFPCLRIIKAKATERPSLLICLGWA